MHNLITKEQANGYYKTISDYVDRYINLEPGHKTSDDLPLYVHFIKKLRTPFHNILVNIPVNELPTHTKLGTKLNFILNEYRPEKPIGKHVLNAWRHCNEAVHYLEEKKNKNLPDFKYTIRNMSSFIREYSGVDVPFKIRTFYKDDDSLPDLNQIKISGNPVINKYSQKQDIDSTVVLTEREKYLGTKAATMLPILFVLDISKSMDNEQRISDLNKGARWFYKSMRTDEITRDCVELGVITFGHDVTNTIKFSSIDSQDAMFTNLNLEAVGDSTNIGEAAKLALDTLINLKAEYSDAGLDYHQPWIVLITDCDGQGIDDYEIAAQKTSDVINQDRLVLFPIGVGSSDLKILKDFSPKRDPLRMKEKSFGQFFDWLKENAEFISRSRPDEKTPLTAPTGWASL